MKHLISRRNFLKAAGVTTAAAAMAVGAPAASACWTGEKSEVTILYTNDVHCGIDDNIGYSGLVAYKKAYEKAGYDVIMVDSGDAIQGDAIGTISTGEYIVDIMNEIGYSVATIGNHEFDYGMDRFMELRDKAKYDYVCCNFTEIGRAHV